MESLVETLSFRQIALVNEEYTVSADGMKMFGVLDLAAGFEGCRFHADRPIMPTTYGFSSGEARGSQTESA